MEDHETRRKIIRLEVASEGQENELRRSRRDAYQRMMGWLLLRIGR
jgi:hypothetical protein